MVSWEGIDEVVPGMISRTRRVPEGVPSERQSSLPEEDSLAVKNT